MTRLVSILMIVLACSGCARLTNESTWRDEYVTGPTGIGRGVVVDFRGDAYLVTAKHVVEPGLPISADWTSPDVASMPVRGEGEPVVGMYGNMTVIYCDGRCAGKVYTIRGPYAGS